MTLHLQSWLLVAFLLALALAAPTQHQRKKRSFKIERVRQHNYVPSGMAAMRKAYQKFSLPGLESLPYSDITRRDAPANEDSTDESNNGTVSAAPTQNDAEFLSPVTIGGQTLVMDFDSGSSDMWVFNTQLSKTVRAGHTVFDPTQSATFKELTGSTFNISYGDGSFSRGGVGTDTVDIGGATVTEQAIGLPTTVAQSFARDVASNGLVGLAFSKLNTIRPQRQKTFFDNVIDDLVQPLFTANLKHGVAGSYEFGNVDATQFEGSLAHVPVDNSLGFWMFPSESFVVGGGKAQTALGGSAIADTGTSLMLVDPAVAKSYYSQVEGSMDSAVSGGYIFPCESSLPDLKVAVGPSYMATVSGQLMNFASAGQDPDTNHDFCFGGVQSNGGSDLQIYGDIFFKSQFISFNGTGPSLGIAPHS